MRLKQYNSALVEQRQRRQQQQPISTLLHNANTDNELFDNYDSLAGGRTTSAGEGRVTNAAADTWDTLQWCNAISSISQNIQLEREDDIRSQYRQQIQVAVVAAAAAQHRQPYNINANVAAVTTQTRQASRPSAPGRTTRSGPTSPDDSLVDYEDAGHQNCSSLGSTPQEEEEERGFLSDDSLSDDGNLPTDIVTTRTRGIVNPNYPGFQHLAHTLEYSIKTTSDVEYSDDDEVEDNGNNVAFNHSNSSNNNNTNNNNNNNNSDNNNDNNNSSEEYSKIDSVNRLDSVENIQKVFYDKPALNIPLEPLERDPEKRNNCLEEEGGSQTASDPRNITTVHFIPQEQTPACDSPGIIGDFRKEIEEELSLIERGVEQDLQEAVEKLNVACDLSPSALKYNIEPNTEESFQKGRLGTVARTDFQQVEIQLKPVNFVLEVQQFPETVTLKDQSPDDIKPVESKIILTKIVDASLSNARDLIEDLFVLNPNNMEVDHTGEIRTKRLNRGDEDLDEEFLSNAQNVIKNIEKEFLLLNETGEARDVKDFVFGRKSEQMDIDDGEPPNNDKIVTAVDEEDVLLFCKENKTKNEPEKDEDSMVPRKKEKIEMKTVDSKKRRNSNQMGSLTSVQRREFGGRNRENLNRRSLPNPREKKRASPEVLGGFDVYNIETAMPKIDLDAIESHLKAARDEERRRRTDREEIRRRLAMGSEDDYYSGNDRPGRKPSLQSRLQSGMNLQICFMNETASDTDSPNSDNEFPVTKPSTPSSKMVKTPSNKVKQRPASLNLSTTPPPVLQPIEQPMSEADFFARQARLQTEARMALAQAKEMAHMQMEIERQRQKKSPITEMIRSSFEKVGIPFPEERRRVSRQILTEMNVAQLQVIVNDLHTQIETLNEQLVRFLMNRDDLHMEQDSMLVDIEDLTRYLGAKERTVKEQHINQNNNMPPSPIPASPLLVINSSMKPRLHRLTSFVKK